MRRGRSVPPPPGQGTMTDDDANIRQNRVEQALKAHARGWALTPLRGKGAFRKGWQEEPPPSEEQTLAWARVGNVGLRTGAVSGVTVLDDDRAKHGLEPSARELLGLDDTVTAVTGSGGLHHYFRSPPLPLKNAVGATGTVSISIPGEMGGDGKVSLVVQGRLTDLNAVTGGPELRVGAAIRVTGLVGNKLVVKADIEASN